MKSRKITALIISFAMVVCMFSGITVAYANDGTYGELTYTVSEGEITITGCDRNATEVDIPAEIDSLPVKYIADRAFAGNKLSSVIIPDSVVSIGVGAFNSCTLLESIIIPASVETIGENVFQGCHNLKEVILSENITSIPNGLFNACRSLEEIEIPLNVSSIGQSAFSGCTSLKEIVIPNGVSSINMSTFGNCSSLQSVFVPASVKRISGNAFRECNELSTVYYEGSEDNWNSIIIQTTGNETFSNAEKFYNCTPPTDKCGENLTYELSDDGVLTISGSGDMTDWDEAESVPWYNERENVTSLVIGDEVATIGKNAFYQFTSLTELNVGNGVWKIGENAFRECSSLANVVVPLSVNYICDSAFAGCSSIEFVDYGGGEDEWNGVCVEGGNDCLTDKILFYGGKYGNCGDEMKWKIVEGGTLVIEGPGDMYDWESSTDVPWNIYNEEIKKINLKDDMNKIGDCAFASLYNVTEVVFGDLENPDPDREFRLNHIGDYAFYRCISLASFPEVKHLEAIGEYAFSNCESLTSFSAYECGQVSIGSGAFDDCWNLENVSFDNSGDINIGGGAFRYCGKLSEIVPMDAIRTIGAGAFCGCESLESMLIPHNDMTRVEDETFSGCVNLKEIDFGWESEVIQSVGYRAFYNCQNLDSIEGLQEVYEVGAEAFANCISLEKIELSSDVEDIGDGAFIRCPITEFNLGNRITEIKSRTFEQCSNLKDITIPQSVIAIGDSAFADCRSLETIVLPDGLETIDFYAFGMCTGLKSIKIPEFVTYIGEEVFNGCLFEKIDVDKKNQCYVSENGVLFDKEKTMLMQYPAMKKDTSYTIPDTVETIGVAAFAGSEYAEEFIIPDSVKKIDCFAFAGCLKLKSIAIPDSVTEIRYENGACGTFRGCENLESVKIGSGITCVGYEMFSGCRKLTQVIMGENVEAIEDYAFAGCESLETINLPASLIFIGYGAFIECRGLISITIPDNVTGIVNEAFRDCTSLITVVIGDSVTVIPGSAFSGCENMTSVTFPHSLESIGDNAFESCDNLKMIYYNGTSAEWRQVEIGDGNDVVQRLPGMYRKSIVWISFYDNEGNFLYKARNTMGEPLFACNVPTDEEENLVKIYTDPGLDVKFNLSTVITENINLYIEKIDGTKTLVSDSEETVEKQVMFTIKGMHMKEGSRVILALYNNGTYVGVQDAVYYQGDIIFKTEIEHTSAKVMVWGNNGMRPLHTAEKVQKNK